MRILIATDNSPHAEVTLRFGAQIARRAGEMVTILTVIRYEASRRQAEAGMDHARQLLQAQVPDVQARVRVGNAAREIVRETKENSYDLVIVGERPDRSRVARSLLGSTAVRVVEHVPCPVLVAKGKAEPIRRILLCDSGANSTPVLSHFAAQLVELLEGEEEVTVLHVMSQMSAGPGVNGKQLRAEATELIDGHAPEGELLERDVRALDRPGVHPQPKVRHGLVVDEILKEAQGGDYDLVIIGAHRGEKWQRLLLEDLARQIVLHLDRPVLVVKQPLALQAAD